MNKPNLRRGFTLIELLVVIVIILALTAASLPVVLPAIRTRKVNEAARVFQATINATRDLAIRNGEPRGLRFLRDPSVDASAGMLAYNRMVQIEPAPDYFEGRVSYVPYVAGDTTTQYPVAWPAPGSAPGATQGFATGTVLMVYEAFANSETATPTFYVNNRTSWFWNVRVGERIRFGDSEHYYTIVGPMVIRGAANPEGYVNVGVPGTTSPLPKAYPAPVGPQPVEFLYLVNGIDDNNDGYIDPILDGLDNNGNSVADEQPGDRYPNNNPVTAADLISEYRTEAETFTETDLQDGFNNSKYTIKRRPTIAEGAREIVLPSDTVIDATTFSTTQERSRLPIDPATGTLEIMISPSGPLVPTTLTNGTALSSGNVFYHFWLAERGDVLPPNNGGRPEVPWLPLPEPVDGQGTPLEGDRRLVTIFARTGLIVTNTLDNDVFDIRSSYTSANPYNAGLPYVKAQLGERGSQ